VVGLKEQIEGVRVVTCSGKLGGSSIGDAIDDLDC